MNAKRKITVIPGDGIGPGIMEATLKVLDHLGCEFEYESVKAGISALDTEGDLLPEASLESISKNKIALKGPLTTPIGGGFTSINVTLRKRFELYANVRPVISFPNTRARYDNIDIVTIRENTEGMYSGHGQVVSDCGQVAEAKSTVTHDGSTRVIEFAFEYAKAHGRKRLTLVHKANILKTTSGLFLKVGQDIASRFPEI